MIDMKEVHGMDEEDESAGSAVNAGANIGCATGCDIRPWFRKGSFGTSC